MEEEVPTIINCHLASFSPRFRLVFERVTISSSACLHARYALAPLLGIQPGVPSLRPHDRRMERRRLSPSGVGVCDRVAVNKELEGKKRSFSAGAN